jgi:hypothetical protein
MLARGETWPGEDREERAVVQQCIRAALNKVNALECALQQPVSETPVAFTGLGLPGDKHTCEKRKDQTPMHPEVAKKSAAMIEACARAAHEANRAYCIAIGDTSQLSWDEAPGWQKSSAVKGVVGVIDGNGPQESHESWLREKEATGWKYGPVKDPEKKEHPCFVPYDELPTAQKMKDGIFVSVVRAMVTALDF